MKESEKSESLGILLTGIFILAPIYLVVLHMIIVNDVWVLGLICPTIVNTVLLGGMYDRYKRGQG
jgi:hypothetical protein